MLQASRTQLQARHRQGGIPVAHRPTRTGAPVRCMQRSQALQHSPRKWASRSGVRAQATTAVASPLGTITSSFKANDSTPVVVLGAQGTAGAQLTKALLEAGFKVTAGVDYPEQAKVTLAFLKKYELLSSAQLSNLKTVESDNALPKRARVIVIENDSLGNGKTDTRFVEDALARAEQADASQVVLITSGGAAAGGGGLFGFGGSSGGSKGLSRTEQLVANSGLSITVLRAATSDRVPEDVPVSVAAGPGRGVSAAAAISQAALSQVVGALLSQPTPPPGLPVVLEVAASATAGPALSDAIAAAINEIKSKLPVPAPVAEKKAPGSQLSGFGTGFSLGTISIKRRSQDEEDDKPATTKGTQKVSVKSAPPPSKPAFAKPAPAKPAAASKKAESDSDEDERESSPVASLFGGLFGGSSTKVIKVDAPAAAAKPAPAKPAPAPPKPAPVRSAPVPARSAVVESSKPARKPNPFSTISSRRPATPEPPAPAKPAAAAKPASNPFSTRSVTPAPPAPAAKSRAVTSPAPAKKATPEPAPARSSSGGGLFGFFAITPTVPGSDDDEPKTPSRASPAARAPPAKPAPKPAPVKAAPVKAAPVKAAPVKAAAPAKPAVSSRSSKSASPEATPAPKSSGGFLSFLFGGSSKKAASDSDDEEVKPRVAARKAPPPPPPPKPAAKAAPAPVRASAPAPSRSAAKPSPAPAAKPSSNPFSSVKRVAPPPPPPAKSAPAQKSGTQQVSKAGTQKTGTQKTGTQSSQKSGTQQLKAGSGTSIRGTYRPVSGYSVQPKK